MNDEITGTTRKIYYYLLTKNRPISPRQIQRDLNISSISVVLYHLKKLEEKGLVRETETGYVINKIIDKDLIKIYKYIIPRSAFFASFFLTSLIIFLTLLQGHQTAQYLFSVLVIMIATTYFIYDTISKWLKLKF
jgi:repressor of nif and glnA expression